MSRQESYRAAFPPSAAATHLNKAAVLRHLGRRDESLQSYREALRLQPDFPEAEYQLGNALLEFGRPEEALRSYQQVLARTPGHAGALCGSGNALQQLRDYAGALSAYERAIEARPDYAEAHNNRGGVLRQLARYEEALASFDRALELKPDSAPLLANRGKVLLDLERFEEAVRAFDAALAARADYPEAWNDRGNALRRLERFPEALSSFDQALARRPDYVLALNNRGNVLRDLRRFREALAHYQRAAHLDPDCLDVQRNLGSVWVDLQQPAAALASCDAALRLNPDDADSLRNRATALQEQRRIPEACACLERLLAVAPEYELARGSLLQLKLDRGLWDDYQRDRGEIEPLLEAGRPVIHPFPMMALTDSPATQHRAASVYLRSARVAAADPSRACGPYGHGRIRVGYVSGDFREHAVSYLLAGVFETHGRERFETLGISLREAEDSPMGRRVRGSFERWVEVGEKSDEQVASLLRELEVDIAVDLMGYTKSSRPGIFARRAAPVQVNYLGYPGTLGAAFMDYIVADEFVIPRAAAVHYAERVVYLPECFQGNDGRRELPLEPPSRARCGLPEGAVVYCCFNSSYKINPQIFEVWCRVLGQVPGSVLWLLGEGEEAGENLRREGRSRGIASERIVLAGRLPYAQHLARLRQADLFLDTLPFNAGTTASDALWAGVPVLTCAGRAYAARMAGSLLHTLGLDELITGSLPEYERRAIEVGSDRGTLAGLKARVCAERSAGVLFDTQRFTRHLEAAYLRMWARAERGEPPQSFAVEPATAAAAAVRA